MSFSRKIFGLIFGVWITTSISLGRTDAIHIGVGDSSIVGISGDLLLARVTSSDPLILEVKRSGTGLVAKGLRPGAGFITIHSKSKVKQIDFSVKPYAATIPGVVTATVSGKPAIAGTVQGSIEGSLKRQLRFAPLAKMTMSFFNVPSIGPGMTLRVPVKLSVSAPGTIPKSGIVTVVVNNIGLMPRNEDALWYCNDPERITKKQNLFAAELDPEKSARLLYHHINDTSRLMVVRTLIVNDSDSEVKVCITPGDSAPTIDPVGAGLRAGDLFLRAWISDSGEVITIPARSCIPISCRKLKPKAVISGLCAIRHIGGTSKLLVRTDAFGLDDLEPRWQPTLSSSTPWREVGAMITRSWDSTEYLISEHVYPSPYRAETAEFTVGGRFSVTRLGQRSILRQDSSGRLDGNFGVIYDIAATITNTQGVAADVELVFEPSAGYSGAIFLIGDRYIMTPKILPKSEARIATYRLKAGEVKNLKIMTMPLSGSSYPATLFIRMVGSGSKPNIIDLSKTQL
jgi:hypothetical protein